MKRLGFFVALPLFALGVRLLRADEVLAPPADAMVSNDAERAVIADLDRGKFIAAREKAEKLPRKSFVGHWALAMAHHYEEGNYARALFHVREAEHLLPTGQKDWQVKVMLEEAGILEEMDRTEEEIVLYDRLAKLYPPGRPGAKIWPLMKQRRYAEAEALAQKLKTSDDENERLNAHNGMLAIEAERNDREAMFQASREAVGIFPDSCLINRNAAIGAWMRFRPQQAEEWLVKASAGSQEDCSDWVPDLVLAALYLEDNQINQAVEAIKKANTIPIPKQYREHSAIIKRGITADLLHLLGKPEEAEQLASDVFEHPERVGRTSGTAAAARLARAMRYWVALDTRLNYERERASYRGLTSGLETRARLLAARWEVRRALFQLTVVDDALVTVARPYLSEVAWNNVATLAAILGPGVMRTALKKAREMDAAYPEATAYFDALSGEVAYRDGELATALDYATKVLDQLPQNSGLLRVHVLAWQSDAKWRRGDREGAMAGFQEVLQKLPSDLRVLDIAVPVTITHDGSSRAKEAAEGLGDSPRFTETSNGFKLDVSSRDKTLTICLSDTHGTQFACESGDGDVETVLDAFHLAAFSPRVNVTQKDLSSLDGSTTSRTADEVLKGMLQ